MATLRLLEILRDQRLPVRFYHASTSEIFGNAAESPQNEETPMRPASPYGCAKAFATRMVTIYRRTFGLFACNGIMYNHESPRREFRDAQNLAGRRGHQTRAAKRIAARQHVGAAGLGLRARLRSWDVDG